MANDSLAAMRQSIIDGAPDTASSLAQQALANGIAAIDAINNGYVPGMHDVGEQFARGQMFLPDMMASAEAMRAAMAVLDPELRKLGTARPTAGVVVLGTTKGDIHEIGKILVGTSPLMDFRCMISASMLPEKSSQPKHSNSAPISSESLPS